MDAKLARGLVREMFRRTSGLSAIKSSTAALINRADRLFRGKQLTSATALVLLREFDEILKTGGSVQSWSRPEIRTKSLKSEFGYSSIHFLPQIAELRYKGASSKFMLLWAVCCLATPMSFSIRVSLTPLRIAPHAIERFLVRSCQGLSDF